MGWVVSDVCYGGVEEKTRVVRSEEGRSFAADECIEAPLIEDIIVCLAVLVEGGVVVDDAEFLGRFFWWICIFPVFESPKTSAHNILRIRKVTHDDVE